MASLSIFFLKFMLAEFSVYMLKQVQQYSRYFPLPLLRTCKVFLTSALRAEKLNADFFFFPKCMQVFFFTIVYDCLYYQPVENTSRLWLSYGWMEKTWCVHWFCVNLYRISHFSVPTLLSEIENKPLNIYSLVSILLSEEAFPSERDMVWMA